MLAAALATGVLAAASLVLFAGGAAKLHRPARPRDRLLGAGEVIAAVAALVAPGRPACAALAGVFGMFAVHHAARTFAGAGEDCGCLGERDSTGGVRAVALTAGAALALTAAAAAGPSGVTQAPPAALAGVPAAALWWLAFRGGAARGGLAGAGERLVTSSADFLERRISRRSALLRLAVAGSAMTVAPLRYLLYPGTALAVVVPGDCGGGLCTDGYTAFCCEINHGRNTCPTGSFPAGWWMCTDYPGRRLCHEEGVRYYVDCNRIPGTHFPGGCRCANDNCGERRVACNVFRYGQCNVHVPGVTEVVCRMVVCENPSRIPGLNCNASLAVDNAVCDHDAPCLKHPPAIELAGAGGV